jgi:hypothetical protein
MKVGGHTTMYILSTPCWALELHYRVLGDLDAYLFMNGKEGWPGMVIDHVIILGTKRVPSLFCINRQFMSYTVVNNTK